ncbi:MAG: hypothetical protein JXA54_13825 [Candidatus Heimdallarchaeota archaeon]|nr:hypothetical protein [Candidatus Heimdallarchaeota archaeon]
MTSTTLQQNPSLFTFDEFRTNLQDAVPHIDSIIKTLKQKDETGDSQAKVLLYLYQGLFSIINAEKKYRSGDYTNAIPEFNEGGKSINRFQRMSTGFSIEYQQDAERLDLFAKGREFECSALKKGVAIDDQIDHLIEAANAYTLEVEIVEKIKKPLLIYNAKARAHFVQGLKTRLEGQKALTSKDYFTAKEKSLAGYRLFLYASYFNPTYTIWINEQNNTIKKISIILLKNQATKAWGDAYKLSNEGKFIESSEVCYLASKLYKRLSTLSIEKKDSLLMNAYSHMLRASMFEAKANEFLKKANDAKGAYPHFELAAEALKQAIDYLPKNDENQILLKRWQIQWKYYLGSFHLTQGIQFLDAEKYKEAIEFLTKAEEEFSIGYKEAVEVKDDSLIKLIEKSSSETKGYIGMCKTVLD